MQAESLNDSEWDVLIVGTGLYQSILALALSRSNQKILHIDKNFYYGGSEAALSLQEAQDWANDESAIDQRAASITKPLQAENGPKLSFSRAYSLALAPQLIYTQSALIRGLVSSKAYRQLEFLAMGSWWVYSSMAGDEDPSTVGKLVRVPTSREDIAFADSTIDIRSKRLVMKVLRFILDFENKTDVWETHKDRSFSEFLTENFNLSTALVDMFQALSMSPNSPDRTSTSYALPRISRHLRSIGVLGPGFSAVIPKWGGLSEIAQVGCRAGAVGGAVYVLGTGASEAVLDQDTYTVRLTNGDQVKVKHIVTSSADLPSGSLGAPESASTSTSTSSRSITIVSSNLKQLFPAVTEGTPAPAGAIVVFPAGSLSEENAVESSSTPPVQLIVHSSETGECPPGQCVIYGLVLDNSPSGAERLKLAIIALLRIVDEPTPPSVLWQMVFKCHHEFDKAPNNPTRMAQSVQTFPSDLPADPVFDDSVFERVEHTWRQIIGDAQGGFLEFDDREGQEEEDEETTL